MIASRLRGETEPLYAGAAGACGFPVPDTSPMNVAAVLRRPRVAILLSLLLLAPMLVAWSHARLRGDAVAEAPADYRVQDLDWVDPTRGRAVPVKLFWPASKRTGKVPLVVFGGKEYGTGSSRDWAAKGSVLLGIRAVVVESFERIHRSNLIGMGVLPLVFEEGTTWKSLGLKGDEQVTIRGLSGELKPRQRLIAEIVMGDGTLKRVPLICRIDTLDEVTYVNNGGILQTVLRDLAA